MGEVVTHPSVRPEGLSPPASLTAGHDLSKFNSDKPPLDDWLRNHALNSEGKTARTYVVCENQTVVVGYYRILTGGVERKMLPSKLKRERGTPRDIPVALIGRLARDVKYRRQGLGADLLQDALSRILSASAIIGIRAVLVHALDDGAARFWKDNEFIESPVGERTFYLPIESIADALANPPA